MKRIAQNSRTAYRLLPPDCVLEVAREILKQQRAGAMPTANTVGRAIGKPSGSVTGRINNILDAGGKIQVDGVTYHIRKTGNVIDPITKRPNAVWNLVAPVGEQQRLF